MGRCNLFNLSSYVNFLTEITSFVALFCTFSNFSCFWLRSSFTSSEAMMMHILIIYSKNKFTNLSNINATIRQIGGKERHSPKLTHSGSQNSIHDTFTVPKSAPHEMTSLCLLTFLFHLRQDGG